MVYQIPCNSCCECMPCPAGIRIPEVFASYNRSLRGEDLGVGQGRLLGEAAADCIRCMRCEQKCRQKIGISSMMMEIAEELVP